MIDINQTADQWAEKLAALRQEMTQQNLAGFIVPMADEYQNEYVPPSARRIEYLTGFTGSAGVVVVLQDQAAFFTDSRYTLQAAAQVPAALYTLFDSAEKTPRDWLAAILPSGARFGYDAWLHAVAGVERLREALPAITLVPVIKNPLDAIWLNRPLPPAPPIVLHGVDYAGQESSSKRNKIAMELARKNIAALIISDPTSIG